MNTRAIMLHSTQKISYTLTLQKSIHAGGGNFSFTSLRKSSSTGLSLRSASRRVCSSNHRSVKVNSTSRTTGYSLYNTFSVVSRSLITKANCPRKSGCGRMPEHGQVKNRKFQFPNYIAESRTTFANIQPPKLPESSSYEMTYPRLSRSNLTPMPIPGDVS